MEIRDVIVPHSMFLGGLPRASFNVLCSSCHVIGLLWLFLGIRLSCQLSAGRVFMGTNMQLIVDTANVPCTSACKRKPEE